MSRKECPSCAVEIERNADVCPICGYEFPQRKTWPRWIAFVVLILIALVFIRMLINNFRLL